MRFLRDVVFLSLAFCGAVYALPMTDLSSAYRDAVQNDPTFQQQKATLQETEQDVPTARAALLPQLFLSAQLAHTYENSEILGDSDYNSNEYNINFTQNIFNAAAFNQLHQAKLSVQSAVVLFSAQTQDLIVRVVRAYLAVLQARDLMQYAHSQELFASDYVRMTSRKRELKFATITDSEQARQQYQMLSGQYLTAKIAYDQSLQSLSNLTAHTYVAFPPLKKQYSCIAMGRQSAADWVRLSKNQNLLLLSSQLKTQAEQQKIRTKKMNFLPTVSEITNYSDTNELSTQAAGGTVETIRATETGISASWNLSQGGQTLSDIERASAGYAKAMAEMRQRYLEAVTNTQNAFIGVQDGLLSLQASRLAVDVGASGLSHTRAGFKAGVQTIFDLLQSQNSLYAAQKQYTQNFYTYILNTILLKQAAGTLCPHDIDELNHYLYGRNYDNPA